jgi:hypothetical protein
MMSISGQFRHPSHHKNCGLSITWRLECYGRFRERESKTRALFGLFA